MTQYKPIINCRDKDKAFLFSEEFQKYLTFKYKKILNYQEDTMELVVLELKEVLNNVKKGD